jgi:hypothetical protein
MNMPMNTTIDPDELGGVARGTRQRSILQSLLTSPEGICTSDWDSSRTQTRLHGSAGYQAWTGMLPRLTAALRQRGVQVTHISGDCWGIVPLTAATLVHALITEPGLQVPQDVVGAVLADLGDRAHHDQEDEALLETTVTDGHLNISVLRALQMLRSQMPHTPLAQLIPIAQTIAA